MTRTIDFQRTMWGGREGTIGKTASCHPSVRHLSREAYKIAKNALVSR